MNYALVENGVVTNIVWIYPEAASCFPGAVPCAETPVSVGDTYHEDYFYHGQERILSKSEALEKMLQEANVTIEELDAALLDTTYQNILGGIE